ncbi:MAG: response regulator [Abditibacteriales bacterium]|nr:response regulator [Abditibacteriales bacterium]MDW8364518.1 response regulator [Abditibacteriales bacterium]
MSKLLLVDDDESARLTLAIALRRRGFEVATATDGFAAIEMLRHERFPWVIADVRMPGMSGVELANQIHLLGADTRTVLISAYHNDQPLDVLGVEAFLEKPIDVAALLRVLRRDSGSDAKRESFAAPRGNGIGPVE